MGGGVALNGVANARILAEAGFERLFVPPAPGDAGCALGAALYADRVYFRNPDREVPDHPFWGPAVDADELARAAREDGQAVDTLDDRTLIERVPGPAGVAGAARRGHARGRLGARPGARARDGAAVVRAARGVRPPHRHPRAAEHVVQRGGRTDRHARARRVFDVQTLRDRRAR